MKLFSKYTVFFEQVVDDVLLLTLDETSQGEYEKLEGKVLGKAAHLHRCSAPLMRELRQESNGPPGRGTGRGLAGGSSADGPDLASDPGDRVFGQDGIFSTFLGPFSVSMSSFKN